VNKEMTLLGLNVCASVFIALSAYGIFLYMDWGAPSQDLTLLSWAGCAVLCAGSIAGIVYFGSHLDRLKRMEQQRLKEGQERGVRPARKNRSRRREP